MKKELPWLVGVFLIVAFGMRLYASRHDSPQQTRVVWTERYSHGCVVTVEFLGDRSGGGANATATLASQRRCHHDGQDVHVTERVSAADYARLLETLEGAGACNLVGVPNDGSNHNDLVMERNGTRHEVAFDQRMGAEYAALDHAVDGSLIGHYIQVVQGLARLQGQHDGPEITGIPGYGVPANFHPHPIRYPTAGLQPILHDTGRNPIHQP